MPTFRIFLCVLSRSTENGIPARRLASREMSTAFRVLAVLRKVRSSIVGGASRPTRTRRWLSCRSSASHSSVCGSSGICTIPLIIFLQSAPTHAQALTSAHGIALTAWPWWLALFPRACARCVSTSDRAGCEPVPWWGMQAMHPEMLGTTFRDHV